MGPPLDYSLHDTFTNRIKSVLTGASWELGT